MAMAAGHNLANSKPGSVNPRMNATEAYQRSLMANEQLLMQKQQQRRRDAYEAQRARLTDAQIAGAERKLDPFADFDDTVERFGWGDKPTDEQISLYKDFVRSSSPASSRVSKTFIGDNGNMWFLDAAGNPSDTGVAAADGKMIDLPSGGKAWRGPDGTITTIVSPAQAVAGAASLEGAKTGAGEQAKTIENQVRKGITGAQEARSAYQAAEGMLKTTDEWLAKLQPGQERVDTGPVAGFMLDVFGIGSEELGELSADTIAATLENLGITNLAPVTEKEFASVMRMWADISNSESVNRGTLAAAKRRTERLMDRIKGDAVYNAGLVEEYGTSGQYNAFRRSNPFVSGLMEASGGASDKGTETPKTGSDTSVVRWTTDENGNPVRAN